ncbi:winged helix-turn-helix domain-containing tetratricopeptide repeat protein [Aurantiacibacter hainanensis]|uniref:winged helix-turn-helix domain-containing tetratricopeptide repeat protein n=1 Tax=Aurantiacibacter hainanensis TaxID=3076114 RepID=UPI0030C70ECA
MTEIEIGRHVLQPNRQLLLDGEHIHLGPRALEILTELAAANGEIVTKDELMEAVWSDVTVEENALQVHVTALRKALGEDAVRLHTIRGIGYQLDLGAAAEPGHDQGPTAAPPSLVSGTALEPAAGANVWRGRRTAIWLGGLIVAVLLLGAMWQLGIRNDPSTTQVTVMPLTAIGDEPEEAALANGITEELIVRLRRIPELEVVSGLSSSQANGNRLHGSVQVDGEEFRVFARLEDGSGEVLWTENFDRELNDLLYVEEEIAAAVASALSVSLNVGLETSGYGGTDDAEAYAHFVQGISYGFGSEIHLSLRHLERAIEIDPDFSRGWAQIVYAQSFALLNDSDASSVRDRLAAMDQASLQAIRTGPDLAIGNAARAWFLLHVNEVALAERFNQRAIRLDPGNDTEFRDRIAFIALQFGRVEDALDYVRSKALIDPIFNRQITPNHLAALFLAGRHQEVVELYEEALASGQDLPDSTLAIVAGSYFSLGDEVASERVASASQTSFMIDWALEFNEQTFPRLPPAALREWADEVYGDTGRFQLAALATRAADKGENELALSYLQLAYDRPGQASYLMLWHPYLGEVRRSEGFEQLIARLGLVDAWRESGDWGDYCRPLSESEFECF